MEEFVMISILNRFKINIHSIIAYVGNLLGYKQITLSNAVYNLENYSQGECDKLLTKNMVEAIVRNVIIDSVKESMTFNAEEQEYGSTSSSGIHPFSNNNKILIATSKPCQPYLTGEFENCLSLLAVGELDTTNVISIANMFKNCLSLRDVDFRSFRIDSIINTANAFQGCRSIKVIDLSNGVLASTSLLSCFDGCTNLEEVRFAKQEITQPVNLQSAFRSCRALKKIDLPIFKSISQLYVAFEYCSSLTQLDVSKWGVKTVSNFNRVFEGCSSLTQLDVSNWDVGNATVFESFFAGCSSLTQLDVSNWNVSKVKNLNRCFSGCSSLTQLDVSNWNVSEVTTLNHCFSGCSSLTLLDVSNWNVSRVTTLEYCFANCSSLTLLDVSNWDVSRVTTLEYCFNNCSSLTQLDVSKWDVSACSTFSSAFRGCSSVTNFDISKWDMRSASTLTYFLTNTNINRFDYPNLQINSEATMTYMLSYCSNLEYIDISNWDIRDNSIACLTRECSNVKTFHMCDFSHNVRTDAYTIHCKNLVTITINGQTTRESFSMAVCGSLSDESIINVANALYDLSEEMESDDFESPTLKLHKSVYQRAENIMIDELDLPTWATLKGWTLIN